MNDVSVNFNRIPTYEKVRRIISISSRIGFYNGPSFLSSSLNETSLYIRI